MQDTKHPVSSKGKAREDAHWQLGWWELCAMNDNARRPLVWSKSSIIFSAHPTQPLVLARHFSSSRQFLIPSPNPILTAPGSYEPPTIISVSPREDWLFAYFPGRDNDDTACIWKRGFSLDSWVPVDFWSLSKGAGIIAAEWIGGDREWVISESGSPSRLPPRGPILPTNSPILLLVTETHQINVCFLPPTVPSLKILRASLLQPTAASDSNPGTTEDAANGPGGRKLCTNAAFGLSHNESSILIAMRSFLLPTHNLGPSTDNPIDMILPIDITQPSTPQEHVQSDEWEMWGEESIIEFCEIVVEYNGISMGIITRPLPPLFRTGSHLIDLAFLCIPPESPMLSSPSITKDPRRQPKDTGEKRGNLYLAASFLDCNDYTSIPKSEIALYSFSRTTPSTSNLHTRWNLRKEGARTFDTTILAFLAPSASRDGILAGFLDSSGITPRKLKEVSVGNIVVLKIPDLSNDDSWEASHIMSTTDNVGRDVPAGVAVSPNHALLCSMGASTGINVRTSVHSLPKRFQGNVPFPAPLPPTHSAKSDLAKSLASAVYSRKSPSDVIHALVLRSTSSAIVSSSLYGALSILESNSIGLSEMWMDEMLGVATEVYLGRAKYAESPAEKDTLTAQWKTAHDMCSIRAFCSAFDDCRSDDSYDLEAIWQLVGLSTWLVDFLERLMKECVTVGDNVTLASPKMEPNVKVEESSDLPLSGSSLTSHSLHSSILLHLVHPYALSNLQTALSHLKRFRDDIGSLSAKGENAQIAKDVLMDAVECSGVDVGALVSVLDECIGTAVKAGVEDLRKSLALCSPVSALTPHLQQTIDKILSSKVIDRPKLFIKASDLVDGVSRMTITDRLKEKDTDVVTKGLLLHRGPNLICVRCGGKSELGGDSNVAGHISLRWRAWEKMWATRCVCGGGWTRSILS